MSGKSPVCGSRTWTKSELLTLEEEWGRTSIPTLAKNLNRTPEAVTLKAQRMGLGAFLLSGDYVTLNQLMKAVNGTNVHTYHLLLPAFYLYELERVGKPVRGEMRGL